ncbi:MAG: HAD family hydrolase [Thermoplasmata archaeon]|nr:HAD family hydrolase [Thermoplasmata archaeon]
MAAPGVPRLVLFDLDDTLFDHSLTSRAALNEVREGESRLQTRELDELWREYLRLLNEDSTGMPSTPELYQVRRAERFRRLGVMCGWSMDVAEANELSASARRNYQRLRRPVPGAPEFVRRVAARTKVGIVTNNELREQEEKLDFLGLTESVEVLVVSADVKVAKPDPRIFKVALDRASVPREEAVMIGDSWMNDVLGARAAGIRPVWFNRFGLRPPTRHRVVELGAFRPLSHADAIVNGSHRPRTTVPRE